MNSNLLVELLILAALLYIAFKLYAIARQLSQVLDRFSRDRESRDVPSSGQTINVNVAPVPGTSPVSVASPQKADEPGSSRSGGLIDAGGSGNTQFASGSPPDEANRQPEKKSVQSGSFAVKCSRCSAENSSYRTECFNCGNPL